MTSNEYVVKLLKLIPGIVEDEVAKQQVVLASYISDNMQTGAHPSWLSDKKRYKYPYVKNKTNKLYANTNALLAAATVKAKSGNITEVIREGATIRLRVGVDLDVVPYARIHELGGNAGVGNSVSIRARPYIAPALKDYESKELAKFLTRVVVKIGALA